jgi:hypothetical protein
MFQSSFEPDVYNAKKSSSSIDLLVSSSFGAHSCASCKFCTCQIQQNFLYGCALWQAESRSQCHDVVSLVFLLESPLWLPLTVQRHSTTSSDAVANQAVPLQSGMIYNRQVKQSELLSMHLIMIWGCNKPAHNPSYNRRLNLLNCRSTGGVSSETSSVSGGTGSGGT